MYCVFNNGLGLKSVDDNYVIVTGDVIFDHVPTSDELIEAFPGYATIIANNEIKNQIFALEASITPRRRNEAYAGIDSGWLTNVITEIANLRSQLISY